MTPSLCDRLFMQPGVSAPKSCRGVMARADHGVGRKGKTMAYVYFFGEGKADGNTNMREILGGKGAGLAEMTNLGVTVPPGFTISTEVCVKYFETGELPAGVKEEVDACLPGFGR